MKKYIRARWLKRQISMLEQEKLRIPEWKKNDPKFFEAFPDFVSRHTTQVSEDLEKYKKELTELEALP